MGCEKMFDFLVCALERLFQKICWEVICSGVALLALWGIAAWQHLGKVCYRQYAFEANA